MCAPPLRKTETVPLQRDIICLRRRTPDRLEIKDRVIAHRTLFGSFNLSDIPERALEGRVFDRIVMMVNPGRPTKSNCLDNYQYPELKELK